MTISKMNIFFALNNVDCTLVNNSCNKSNSSGVFLPGTHQTNGEHISDYIFTTVGYRDVSHAAGGTSTASATFQGVDIPLLKFIVWGVLGSILAVLGFLGNTLSMVVLHRRQMRSSTSYYLLSLAIYDNGILLGMMIYFCLPALVPYTFFLTDYTLFMSLTLPFGYPLSLSAQMGSIYTCVGFTVERFIAVCRPLHAANTCTRSRTIRAILLIFIWSVAYNIPRFFQYSVDLPERYYRPSEISPSEMDNNSYFGLQSSESHSIDTTTTLCPSNITSDISFSRVILNSSDSTTDQLSTVNLPNFISATQWTRKSKHPNIMHRVTDFGNNSTFKHLYLIYFQLFFMFLLPFLIILIMNIGLIRAVRGSRTMHQSMCASARKEHSLTVMLIAVIVVFLVCQFPTIIDNILVAVMGEEALHTNKAYMCFWILCTFMVEINAASNFLLYCFFGKKFRIMLLNILGIKRKQHQVAYRSTVCKSRSNGTRTYEMEVSVM